MKTKNVILLTLLPIIVLGFIMGLIYYAFQFGVYLADRYFIKMIRRITI